MFRFSLEAVLDVRRRAEEAAQREMGEAQRKLSEIEDHIAWLGEQLAIAARRRREMIESGYMPARVELFAAYSVDVRAQIENAEKEAEKAREVVERCRRKLIRAARDHEVMEELKKREREEYDRRELKEERKRNDDIAVFSYSRKRSENNSYRQEA